MESKTEYNIITILGHTAAGKTRLAALVADALNGEVISADSRQVYKGMTIGTGKDLEDYIVGERTIPAHLVDILEAGEEYNVFEFQKDFLSAYDLIVEKGKLAVLCGGSGMYIESVLRQYDLLQVPINEGLRKRMEKHSLEELAEILAAYKSMHNKSDVDTRKRAIRAIEIADYMQNIASTKPVIPEMDSLNIGIAFDRDIRRQRITERLEQRLSEGLVDEAKALLEAGVSHEKLEYYGLEYKFLSQYLRGDLDYKSMFSGLNTAIHQFAKRQMTYFRGMERRGIKIHWMNMVQKPELIVNDILDLSRST